MNLCDKLREDTILIPLNAATRDEAIQELLIQLQNLEIVSGTVELFNNIDEQEKANPSAAGRGIAYPHSTSTEISKLIGILGISKAGVDFDSPDGQLCHLILLTLSPEGDPCGHRKFISRFRTMVENPGIRFQLVDIELPRDAVDIIHQWELDEALDNDLE